MAAIRHPILALHQRLDIRQQFLFDRLPIARAGWNRWIALDLARDVAVRHDYDHRLNLAVGQ
jgi:hypothetical protein